MKAVSGMTCLTLALASCVSVPGTNPIHVDVLKQTTSSWDGSALPKYPTGQPEVTILKIRIAPGARLPWHKHPIINGGVLLHGKLTIYAEDHRSFHLSAGDPFVEEVNKWHYGANEGTETAEVIVFYAGEPGVPLSIPRDGDH